MILFVGDKPSKRTDPDVPFKGAACEKRLNEWIEYLGLSRESYRSNSIYIINQTDIPKSPLIITVCKWTGIIALGNNASKALKSIPHFKLPHPSGRNRQINDSEFIAKKLAECKRYIEGFK